MAPQNGGGGSMISTLIMFAAIFAIFYFMIIRPQQKRAKERDAMLNAVQKGDKVVLSSGIHGTIVGIEDKTYLIQVSDNVKIKFEKTAVASVVKS
ncbi:MAG: preprotein translocase subunit YajC [Ignavibacteriales bacterium]|nr:MAG: preprotein translocase subunit YajC [Ignavibacteriales bacterium]